MDVLPCRHKDLPLAGISISVQDSLLMTENLRCQPDLWVLHNQNLKKRLLKLQHLDLLYIFGLRNLRLFYPVKLHTGEVIDIFPKYVFNPVTVGIGSGDNAGAFCPWGQSWWYHAPPTGTMMGCLDKPTAHLSRPVLTYIHTKHFWLCFLKYRTCLPILYLRIVSYLAYRLEFIVWHVTTADQRGLQLEPIILHTLISVIRHYRQGDLIQCFGH